MAFSSKRGRPKQLPKPPHDLGTPELLAKRDAGMTREPLDHCLDKKLISPRQHWCGLHLRWLYTLRYGAPGVRCSSYTIDAVSSARIDEPEWRLARECEYKEAITALQRAQCYEAVMGLCVFHDIPGFLNQRLLENAFNNPIIAARLSNEYQRLNDGLSLLSALWKA